MASGYFFLTSFLVCVADILGQSTTCEAIRQFTQGSVICSTPANCCTRFLCNINIIPSFSSDFQVNPCSSPPSLSALIEAGGAVLLNQTDISTSQHIPINYVGRQLGTELTLFVNSTEDSLTFAVSVGDIEVIPETTIPIDTSQCLTNSTDICFPTPVTEAGPGAVTPPPSSIPTCLALQQVASRNLLGVTTNNCAVTNRCTRLSCTYLDLYPFSFTILPCNAPPAIEFTIYNDTGREGVLVDETLSRTRRIPLEDLGPDSAVYISVEHPCGRSAIVVELTLYWFYNSTIIPRTEIPIDQSNCSTVSPSSYPCIMPPAPPNNTCDALQLASRSSGGVCSTNTAAECSSMVCDLDPFSLPILYNLTVLPCLDVPGVSFLLSSNGTVLVDEVLTQSRTERVRVGPANVTLNVIVLQSSDMSSIEVGVKLVVPDTPVEFPVFPLTVIPLDRCSCPQITCLSTTAEPVATLATQPTESPGRPVQSTGPVSSQSTGPVDRMTSSQSAGPVDITTSLSDSPQPENTNAAASQSAGSSGSRVVAPTVIAALLFLALVGTIAMAALIFVVMKRRHNAYRKNFDNMSYGYVKARNEDM